MKIIDLFSGIGGFSLGFQRAGYHFTEHYFSEIDKHAIANYKNNFPNAKYIGDITTIRPTDVAGADIITFGSPCQDFSLAGKRAGLAGAKSSLIEYAIALIADIRPSVFIWENVKGAFSSNAGADFWAILQAFANIGGYRLEWQLLNTSWILPQNRERIYLIGHLAGRSEPGVFPITENDRLFNRETREENRKCASIKTSPARTITSRYYKMGSNDTYIQVGTYRTHNDGKGFREVRSNIAPTIPARAREDGSGMPVIRKNGIRRLTEIECERLQGFPDNWTQYGNYDGTIKPIAKTQRYKLIGNAVTVNIVELVAKRLKIINND